MVMAMILYAVTGYGQGTQPIAVDKTDVRIFQSTKPQSEVSISINKTSPNIILVSAQTDFTGNSLQGYYVSNNFGAAGSWFGADKLPNGQFGRGDPATTFDANGRAYLVSMTPTSPTTSAPFGLPNGYEVQTSANDGITWSNDIVAAGPGVSGDFDKEMFTVFDELQGSPYTNYFYCAWTDFGTCSVKFNRSTNFLSTFSTPTTLTTNLGQGTNVQTGPNGEVYVCWSDFGAVSCSACCGTNIGFAASTDGGSTFINSLPFSISSPRTTLSKTAVFGSTRINDFPSMAVDKSCAPRGKRGRIYIAYVTLDGSGKSIVQVRYSDNATSWSAAATVSVSSGKEAWFPWVAVDDATGLVNVVYYSVDNATNTVTNTYLAYSTDNGSSWQNTKVSDQSHNTAPISGFADGYAGDYIGLASYGGSSYAAWMDNRSGTWQVYVSRIDFPGVPVVYTSSSDLALNTPSIISDKREYDAVNNIKVANVSKVSDGLAGHLDLKAGKSITMNPGFTTTSGDYFMAVIQPVTACQTPGISYNKVGDIFGQLDLTPAPKESTKITCFPNPAESDITFEYHSTNDDKSVVILLISDLLGHILKKILVENNNDGNYTTTINPSDLSYGSYLYTFKTSEGAFSDKFVIIK